jgi:hypothetical protein
MHAALPPAQASACPTHLRCQRSSWCTQARRRSQPPPGPVSYGGHQQALSVDVSFGASDTHMQVSCCQHHAVPQRHAGLKQCNSTTSATGPWLGCPQQGLHQGSSAACCACQLAQQATGIASSGHAGCTSCGDQALHPCQQLPCPALFCPVLPCSALFCQATAHLWGLCSISSCRWGSMEYVQPVTTLVLPPSKALQEQAQELRRYCSSLGEGRQGGSRSSKEQRKQGRQGLRTRGAVHHSILQAGPQLECKLSTTAAAVSQVRCSTAAAPDSA